MYVKGSELRREAYRLVKYLAGKGLSPIFTWETHELIGTTTTLTKVGVSFLADCVISLRFVEIESSMRKAMVVLKVRGSDHDKQLREFEITSKGIKIGAPFSRYERVMSGAPQKSWTEETISGWTRAFAGKP
jgi:circadian clock protein KaiC